MPNKRKIQTSEPVNADYDEIKNILIGSVITGAYQRGKITLDELKDRQIVIDKIIKPAAKQSTKISFVIDYRETILKEARNFNSQGKKHSALVFYALYFEHEINGLLRLIMERKGLKEKSIDGPMRLPIKDKITWLADLLEIKRPSDKFIKFLIPFADNRNGYIHYKWKGVDVDDHRQEKMIEKLLSEIETQITYLKSYTSRIVYEGNKKKVKSSVDKLLNE